MKFTLCLYPHYVNRIGTNLCFQKNHYNRTDHTYFKKKRIKIGLYTCECVTHSQAQGAQNSGLKRILTLGIWANSHIYLTFNFLIGKNKTYDQIVS